MPPPIPPPNPLSLGSSNPPPILPPDPFRAHKSLQPPLLDYQNLPPFRPRRKSLGLFAGIFYCLLLIASALAILFLYRVGADGLYQSSGTVDLGPLGQLTAGPVEVYIVPHLTDDLRSRMTIQFGASLNAIAPFLGVTTQSEKLPSTWPTTPLGSALLVRMPNALYGITNSDRSQFLIQPLPIDSRYRQPGSPAHLYLMEPLAYSRYRDALTFLTPDAYSQTIASLRDQATRDLDLLDGQTHSCPPNSDTDFLTLLDYAWIGKFLAFLNELPHSPETLLAAARSHAVSSSPAAITYEASNFDSQLADLAIGWATLPPRAANSTVATFTVQGRGTPIIRIPVAGGNVLYLIIPDYDEGGGITTTLTGSHFHFDPAYALQHLFPTQPDLTQSPATP